MTTLDALRKLDGLRLFLEWLEKEAWSLRRLDGDEFAREILLQMDLYGIIDHFGPENPATDPPAAKKCPPHEWRQSPSGLVRWCADERCLAYSCREHTADPWPSE